MPGDGCNVVEVSVVVHVKTRQFASRSAALQRAIRLLRASELTESYAAAFREWSDDPDSDAWDTATGDA